MIIVVVVVTVLLTGMEVLSPVVPVDVASLEGTALGLVLIAGVALGRVELRVECAWRCLGFLIGLHDTARRSCRRY